MNDIERQLTACAERLPSAPPPPDRLIDTVRAGAHTRRAPVAPRRWVRRGRVGGIIAFAALVTAAGLAIGGALPFDLPRGAKEQLATDNATTVGDVRSGTQAVVLAPGAGAGVASGELCLSLANRQGPGDVSPAVCQSRDRTGDPGFEFVERPPAGEGWWLHVRLPDPDDPRSAIIRERAIPASGGAVSINSAGRTVTRTFPDTAALDARVDRDRATWQEEVRQMALRGLLEPRVQRLLPTLPAQQREVLRMRVQEGFAYEEILARTGLSPDEFRNHLSIALRTLGIKTDGMLP